MSDIKLQDVGEVHLCVEVYVRYGGKVLMHRRNMTKAHHPGAYLGPGGHVNKDESIVDAAVREVAEETGLVVAPESMKLKYIASHHHLDSQTVWVVWGFLSEPTTIKGKLAATDEGESEWVDQAHLLAHREQIFPPSLENIDHVLGDGAGIVYTSSDWRDYQLVTTHKRTTA